MFSVSNILRYAALTAAFQTLVESIPIDQTQNTGRLEERGILNVNVTSVACGLFSTSDQQDDNTNSNTLVNKGGSATCPARSCTRLGCYNTSGLYLCNDQDVEITVSLPDIANQALTFGQAEAYDLSTPYSSGSYQIFSAEQGGYNIIGAYCDTNDPENISPATYAAPGPNGPAFNVCGGNDGEVQCGPGSATISNINPVNQETVPCGQWMGPKYSQAGDDLTLTVTQTIGTTWTVGGMLSGNIGDLSMPLLSLGFTGTYGQTSTSGDNAGSNFQCGSEIGGNGARGNWTCGIEILPSCVQMSGTADASANLNNGNTMVGTLTWQVLAPLIVNNDNQAVQSINGCTCKNCPGWADSGAPQAFCSLDCQTCDTPPGGT